MKSLPSSSSLCSRVTGQTPAGAGWRRRRMVELPAHAAQILDVRLVEAAGHRLLIDTRYFPSASAEELAELEAIIDSLRIHSSAGN